MQIPILNGIYSDATGDFRTSYPRNLVPVAKSTGVSTGYLKPADGIVANGAGGPGIDRGAINWNGKLYRVMGTKLVSVDKVGTVTVLGDVGGAGQVSLDYSFDKLAIASNGILWYWDGAHLTSVTDSDIGVVKDVKWIGGYYTTTDGTFIAVTDLDNPYSVNPLKYGSLTSPETLFAIDELRNEMYAFARYTIEVFDNIGGINFPFQVNQGAQVPKGIIGTHAYCSIGDTFIFLGSGFGEAPGVYMLVPGDTQKLSTREIDRLLLDYTEAQLATVVVETKVDRNHQFVLFHLPDQCLVYDTIGSKLLGEPVWFPLTSSIVGKGTYRARNFSWCYDQWNVGDPTSNSLGITSDSVSTHYGQTIGWDFATLVLYAEGNGAIVHELELVALTGRVAAGTDPVIWTQYSLDGETWSVERSARAGRQGQRAQRICWRTQGKFQSTRIQRFRGTSDAHLSFARLQAVIEPLFTRPGNGR